MEYATVKKLWQRTKRSSVTTSGAGGAAPVTVTMS
jgi:hypothetical protein